MGDAEGDVHVALLQPEMTGYQSAEALGPRQQHG